MKQTLAALFLTGLAALAACGPATSPDPSCDENCVTNHPKGGIGLRGCLSDCDLEKPQKDSDGDGATGEAQTP